MREIKFRAWDTQLNKWAELDKLLGQGKIGLSNTDDGNNGAN